MKKFTVIASLSLFLLNSPMQACYKKLGSHSLKQTLYARPDFRSVASCSKEPNRILKAAYDRIVAGKDHDHATALLNKGHEYNKFKNHPHFAKLEDAVINNDKKYETIFLADRKKEATTRRCDDIQDDLMTLNIIVDLIDLD